MGITDCPNANRTARRMGAAFQAASILTPFDLASGLGARLGLVNSYWKAIRSVRLSVTDFGFKGWFVRLALPEFKTL